jgi:hypothetical protein
VTNVAYRSSRSNPVLLVVIVVVRSSVIVMGDSMTFIVVVMRIMREMFYSIIISSVVTSCMCLSSAAMTAMIWRCMRYRVYKTITTSRFSVMMITVVVGIVASSVRRVGSIPVSGGSTIMDVSVRITMKGMIRVWNMTAMRQVW